MVEMLGAERLVHARLAAGPGAPLLTARIDATQRAPTVDDLVTLLTAAEHLHGYDPATQRRVARAG
jgi:hypothetical protein